MLREACEWCSPLRHEAARLQIATAARPVDHLPIACRFDARFDFCRQKRADGSRWDIDQLMRYVVHGDRRAPFLRSLCERIDAQDWQAEDIDVDEHWRRMGVVLAEAGQEHFSPAGCSEQAQETTDMISTRARLLQQRSRVRHRLVQGGRGAERLVTLQLRIVGKRLRTLRRNEQTQRKRQLEQEMWDAWRSRDFSGVWRLARRLAGTRARPGRRFYGVARRYRCTMAEWRGFLSKPGREGGLGCVDRRDDQIPSAPAQANDDILRLTGEDLEGLRASAWRMRFRRSVPPWSVPAEVWRLVLQPRFVLRPQRHTGVGARAMCETEQCEAQAILHRWLMLFLEKVRRNGRLPRIWHKSWAMDIDKNPKPGPEGQRLVHRLDPFVKLFYKQLDRCVPAGGRPTIPTYHFGCLPRRRREEAVLAKLALSWRLRARGVSHAVVLFDLRNAFGAVRQCGLVEHVRRCFPPQEAALSR